MKKGILLHEASDDVGRLPGMATGAHRQIDVGLGDFQFLEKNIRHVGVVVLAGVDDGLTAAFQSAQGSDYRGRLHEVRPRANYVKYVHRA